MSWIGRKKIAFLPVHRSHAFPPDDAVPADWPNEIFRRLFFDPDTVTKMDRSLRAFLHAVSSGRADFDAVVLPMQTVDEQNVGVDAFEGQFGDSLRSQGFNAAALVMLGGPGAGSGDLGGFWARFVMRESLGIWAMELMHVLCDIADLYTFDGNMGRFDEMAAAVGTHPSAYTKLLAGWLDASAIAIHHATKRSYELHALELVQPPPHGRFAAVRIGAQVPYLMVEARLMADQFDSANEFEPGIPSQGVIVYQVQTSDPRGAAQNSQAPLLLLTPTALAVGQSFTSGNNIRVTVNAAISGGVQITIDEPGHATVPDVFQLSPQQAVNAIHAAGLVAKLPASQPPGSRVSSQKPSAGTLVVLGSTVTLTLKTGPGQ